MERDPLGERLPNPFATGDLEGQTILAKRNAIRQVVCHQTDA